MKEEMDGEVFFPARVGNFFVGNIIKEPFPNRVLKRRANSYVSCKGKSKNTKKGN